MRIELKDFSELEQKLVQSFKRGLSDFKHFRKKNLMEMYNLFNKIVDYEIHFIPGL